MGQLLDVETVARFMLAGNAIVTLESARTGVRYTYRVRQSTKAGGPAFVEVLVGPDNMADYAYLGTIFGGRDDQGPVYYHGRKSTIGSGAPSAKAFAWAFGSIARGVLPDDLRVYHEGRCGRCGRVLTVPESILSGLGPDCAEKSSF